MATVDRIQGLSSSLGVKAPVVCATTGVVTLSGLQTIDGVVLTEGDRVLVKDQADTATNGIYDASTSDWARSLDFNKSNDVVKGTLVLVAGGTVNTGFAFVVSGTNPIMPGASMITFSPSGVAAELPLAVEEGGTSGSTQAAALTALGGVLNAVISKAADYAVAAGDRGKLIDYTSGTYNLTLLAAATAGDGFTIGVRNSGAGIITIDPNASELVDGAASITLAAGESCLVACDGTGWKTVGKNSSGGGGGGGVLNAVISKAADYAVAAGDRGKLIDYTSGTYNLTLLAAATAGDGFTIGVRNSGAGIITIDPNASELVDGAASITLAAGESCLVACDGTGWKTVGKNSSGGGGGGGGLLRVTRFSTPGSGTWTKPADVNRITIKAVGGGGGGGNIIASNPSGAGGGAGGYGEIDIASPAASYAYTVGAGGAGRAAYSAGAGGSGGSTTIAGITALPGAPGPATNGAPGAGGGCSGGDVNYYGGMGPSAGWQHGGASHFAPGGFGTSNVVTNAVDGSRGSGGGGGGGSGVGYNSGAGGAGYIEIWEYAA